MLQDLVRDGKTKEAVDLLLKNNQDLPLHNEALLLSSRIKNLRKEKQHGSISDDEYRREMTKINADLLDLLSDIESDVQNR